jgi:hypothetical protein
LALLVGCAAVLAGCSATVSSHGLRAVASTHNVASASSAAAGARFARTPSSTAIGDPAAVDVCSVVDETSFSRSPYHVTAHDDRRAAGFCHRIAAAVGGT